MPQNTLAGGGVGVCVYEAAGGGVIIAGLQIIQFRFAVVVVATVVQKDSLSHAFEAWISLPKAGKSSVTSLSLRWIQFSFLLP